MSPKRRSRKKRLLKSIGKVLIVVGIMTLLLMAVVGRFLKYNRSLWRPHGSGMNTAERHRLWHTYRVGFTWYINTPSGAVFNNGDGTAHPEKNVTKQDYSNACAITGWRQEQSR
jgi:hypothetical protein